MFEADAHNQYSIDSQLLCTVKYNGTEQLMISSAVEHFLSAKRTMESARFLLGFFIANKSLFTEYELPAFLVKFDVTYSLNTLAAKCVQNVDALLKDANTTISSNKESVCSLLNPGKFIIDSISSSPLTFKVSISLSFVGKLIINTVSFF